jgi:hypothetical protein
MGATTAYQRIGDLLVAEGLLTEEQMREALVWKTKTKKRFGEVLTELGFVLEEHVTLALAKQFDHPVVDLTEIVPQPEALAAINQAFAMQHLCLPLKVDSLSFTVVITDPLDVNTIDLLANTLRRRVDICLATPSSLRRAINKAYLSTTAGRLRKRTTRVPKDRALLLSILDGEVKPKATRKRKSSTSEVAA